MRRTILIVVLFIIVGIISTYITMKILIRGEEVQVPSVVGLKSWQAADICSSRGLHLKEKGRKFDDTVPEDSIIYQEPQANDSVKKGRNVWVFISKGSKMTYVPDLFSQPLTRANVVIASSGLVAGQVARVYSESVSYNKVIAQNPIPMEMVKRGMPVNLLVSKGEHVSYYLMPDLVGKKLSSAKKTISKMGIEKIKLSFRKDDKLNDDIILVQKPNPESIISSDSVVDIEVNSKDAARGQSDLRYVAVYFDVPEDGNTMKRVKIVLINSDGRKEIFNEVRQAGTKIETFVGISGEAEIEIYINENLVEERKL